MPLPRRSHRASILVRGLSAAIVAGASAQSGLHAQPAATGPPEQLLIAQSEAEQAADLEFQRGQTAYLQGDFRKALEHWLPLAEKGRASAQYSVGDMFYNGEGTEADLAKAVFWLSKAAETGVAAAQYHLGWLFAQGKGVDRDGIQAYKWFALAAFQGMAEGAQAIAKLAGSLGDEGVREAERLVAEWRSQCKLRPPNREFMTNPRILPKTKKTPVFPELPKTARVGGLVILQAIVSTGGAVRDPRVLRCNRPNMGFEDAAVDAVSQWRYEPARLCGEPVEVYFTVVVEFNLRFNLRR